MLRRLRRRVSSSLSKIPPTSSYAVDEWLTQPIVELTPYDIPANLLFSNTSSKEADVPVFKRTSVFAPTKKVFPALTAEIGDCTDKIYFSKYIDLCISDNLLFSCCAVEEKVQFKEHINSCISDNLACISPAIHEIELACMERVKIDGLHGEESLAITSDVIDLIEELEEVDFQEHNVSLNLFQPLGRRNTEGRNYRPKEPKQQCLFDDTAEETQTVGKVRKAYSLRKNSLINPVQQQNVWDLLYPLLLPPIALDFSEQFDLFKPLFGYQQKGIEFLFGNISALLADEMGTGKTVQSVVALRLLFRQGKVTSALILCPPVIIGSAFLSNKTGKSEGWDGHVYHWAPDLSVTVVRGSREQRKLDWNCPAHIYITTFDTLRNDLAEGLIESEDLNKFDCVIVDEAQNIKNKTSGRAKAVFKLIPKYRWALTGTPIENKVEDVISIFDFVKPGLFNQQYYTPQEIKDCITPFFLRRLKRDVMKDLPAKIRQEEWIELDAEQRTAYNEVLASGRAQLSDKLKTDNEFQVRAHIFRLLQQLKQICNFGPDKFESPKTNLVLDCVETISQNSEKVLIFSQYEEYGLSRLERLLKDRGIKFVSYRGGMSDNERRRVVNEFRSKPDITVFLATIRSAGVGLTLTEASYVIHFDHWWNPAVMWQAEDRAHRHGQKNNLTVYSLWVLDTIEEQINEKLRQKGLLIENVIDSLAVDAVEEMISTDEWLEIFGVDTPKEEGQFAPSAMSIDEALKKLRMFSPREFEIITKDFFVKLGYKNARVTQQSRDGGIDVYGSRKFNSIDQLFFAQCKRTDSVGVTVARELLGVLTANPRVSKGFLITSGVFSEDCRRFAAIDTRVNLIDGAMLANYLLQFKLI